MHRSNVKIIDYIFILHHIHCNCWILFLLYRTRLLSDLGYSLCLSPTSLYLSSVKAMLMLSRMAFLQLSEEKNAADLEIWCIQARLELDLISLRYSAAWASSIVITLIFLKVKYKSLSHSNKCFKRNKPVLSRNTAWKFLFLFHTSRNTRLFPFI